MTSLLLCLPAQAWYNGNWMYRHRISTLNSQVNGDQTNFPVYLDLQHLPGEFFTYVDANGADIRMTANDGVTEIPYELVSLDRASLKGELWFRAPSISSTFNSDFFIYYGNANGTAYNDFDEFGAQSVWANGYNLVSHFNGDPSLPIKDSSFIANSILSNGGMTITNSVRLDEIEDALSFDGTDDELEVNRQSLIQRAIQPHRAYNFEGDDDSIDMPNVAVTENGTATFWLKVTPGSSGLRTILDLGNTGNTGLWIGVLTLGSDALRFQWGDGTVTANTSPLINNGEWIFGALTWNASELKPYIDGELLSTHTNHVLTNVTGYDQTIGRQTTIRYFNGQLFDIRIFDQVLSENEIKSVYNFRPINKTPLLWYKADDTHPTIAFDASGNSNNGTKANIDVNNFHYEGNDVPYSYQNSVGYGRSGYANNGDHINLDIYSEVEGNWRNGGTTQPDVGFGTFFGKNAKWVTFTAASSTGYAGSRAETDRSITVVVGQRYSASTLVRASRNLVGGEQITVYYTGSQGMLVRTLTAADDLTTDWLYGDVEFSTGGTPGTIGLVVYLQGAVASDITFYVAEHQLVKGSSVDDNTYAATFGLPAGTYLPKDESKPNQNLDIYNGELLFKGKAPDYVLYNGSFAGNCDGVNDFIDTGILAAGSVGSIKAKFSLDDIVSSHIMVGTQDGAGRAYLGHVADNLGAGVGNDSWGSIIGTTSLNAGQVYNGEIAWDGSRVYLYLDGELEYSSTQSGTPNTNNNYFACAHNTGAAGFHFDGQLFDVQIYNGSNLDLHYPFAEGQGKVLHDVSGNYNDGILENTVNGINFWGPRQDLFHYNAKNGFNRVHSYDGSWRVRSSNLNLTATDVLEIELDFSIDALPVNQLLITHGFVSDFRVLLATGGNLQWGYRNSVNAVQFSNLLTGMNEKEYYQLRIRAVESNGSVALYDRTNGSLLSFTNGLDMVFNDSTYLDIGSYPLSSSINAAQTTSIYRIKVLTDGTSQAHLELPDLTNLNGSLSFSIPVGTERFKYIPALSNGSSAADGSPLLNSGGAFDNKAESQIFIPDSQLNPGNGDILNIQKIFKTNDTGIETLLKKGNDNHGYELRINNGVIEFEAMNQNGSFSVSAGAGLNDNQEHIVHVLIDPGTEIEIFVDGQELNSTSISSPEEFVNAYSVIIANPNNGSSFFSGISDELRFSNHTIDPSWVNTEYENIFNTADFYLIDNLTPLHGGSNSMFWGGQ